MRVYSPKRQFSVPGPLRLDTVPTWECQAQEPTELPPFAQSPIINLLSREGKQSEVSEDGAASIQSHVLSL